MLIEFRQGIYRQQNTPTFLTFTGTGVNINAENSPTIITAAHGRSNYLFTEDGSITSAWSGPFPKDDKSWLYWDIGLSTGKRTFGYTTVDPFTDKGYGQHLPSKPKVGQHFFLTTENKMKHFTGKGWKTVIRVFAGVVRYNAQIDVFENGTQIGGNVRGFAGHILFNSDDVPIKKSGLFDSGEFFTTETTFSPQNDTGNTYKIDNTQISARAIDPVPKFHCVNLKGNKLLGLASHTTPDRPCIGVAVEDFVKDHIGRIVTHGVIENPDFWNFTEPYGTSIWVGPTGQITTAVPQLEALQKIGYVINPTTVYIDIRQVVKLIEYDDDCFVPSPTPTATVTMTPTLTMTPTVTPTMTITPTLTPTVTPTPSVAPPPEIVPLTLHEWKMGEDVGSILFDTGQADVLVDVPSHEGYFAYKSILRDPRFYVQDAGGTTANSYQTDNSTTGTLAQAVTNENQAWSYSFWINPWNPYIHGWWDNFIYTTILNGSAVYDDYNRSVGVPNGRNDYICTTYDSIPLGLWTHVVMTFGNKNPGGTSNGIQILDGGIDYTVGDAIVVNGGDGLDPSTFTVNTIDVNGAITSMSAAYNGTYTISPPSPTTLSGGTGSGAIVDLMFNKDVNFYINGVLDSTILDQRISSFTLTGLASGTDEDTFAGLMNHTKVFNYALTQLNVTDLFGSYTIVEENAASFNQTKISPARNITYNKQTRNIRTAPYELDSKLDLYLKPDESQLFFYGDTSETVYPINFLSPGDLSTAQFGLNTIPHEIRPNADRGAFSFTSDGSIAYRMTDSWDDTIIAAYDCPTAWDLSTSVRRSENVRPLAKVLYADYLNLSGVVSDIRFNPDGSKAYLLDREPAIIQYSCSPAYDISTMVYDGYTAIADSSALQFEFNPTGTMCYILGTGGDKILQYDLGTPWDMLTAVFNADRYSTASVAADMRDIMFTSDGTRFFVLYSAGGYIVEFVCGTPWDVKTATYTLGSYHIFSGINAPTSGAFSPDGTKFYGTSSSANAIFQHTLSTPWDISTITYDSVSISVSAQGHSAGNMWFKPDGLKMYQAMSTYYIRSYTLLSPWDITGMTYDGDVASFIPNPSPRTLDLNPDGTRMYIGDTENLTEYALDTPWDVSTANSIPQSYDASSEDSGTIEVYFKPDGTAFYVMGDPFIFQYSCSVAWDVSSGSYTTKSFDTGVETSWVAGMVFRPDGTKFFVSDRNTDLVHQYSCGTPWDVSTASVDVATLSLGSQDATNQGIEFSADGTKLYMAGWSTTNLYQYTCPTPWDLTGASYSGKTLEISAEQSTPKGLAFKPDGLKMYLVGTAGTELDEYTLGTAWDITTAVHEPTVATDLGDANGAWGVTFDTTGDNMYIMGSVGLLVQYSLSSPWDINTADDGKKSLNIAPFETAPTGIYFKSTGDTFYLYGTANDSVIQFAMSPAWDITTGISTTPQFYTGGEDSSPVGFSIKPDGNKLYVAGATADVVYQYTLVTPWIIDTAVYDSVVSPVMPTGIRGSTVFKPDGTKMFGTVNGTAQDFIEHTLATPWDITTLSENLGSYTITEGTNIRGIFFKSDGTKMYAVADETTTSPMYQYTLTTAWDLGTCSYDSVTIDIFTEVTSPDAIYIKPDGTKMFIYGGNFVYQYNMGTPWDLSTAVYDTISLAVTGTPSWTMKFKDDGTQLYVGADSVLNRYTLGTPWDLSTAVLNDDPFSVEQYGGNTDYEAVGDVFYSHVFSNDGTKLFTGTTGDFGIYQWDVTDAWTPIMAHSTQGIYIIDDSFCVSPDATAMVNYYGNAPRELIVYKKSVGVWSEYAAITVVTSSGHNTQLSNSGQYLFADDTVTKNYRVYEDQLDGTYLEIFAHPYVNYSDVYVTSISNDGSILTLNNVVYRQSGNNWILEQTLADSSVYFHQFIEGCSVSGDGTRIVTSHGDYYQEMSWRGQERQMWKYDTGTWVPENVLPLDDVIDIITWDEYSVRTTADSLGQAAWDNKSLMSMSDDGSVVVINYELHDSYRQYAGWATGALVYRESTPGVWTYVQKLRAQLPISVDYPGASEGDPGTVVAVSADGNRIVTSHIDSDFTQGGGHGKLNVFDWNGTSEEYEFMNFIEPMESWYGDLYGVVIYLSPDGQYIYSQGGTSDEAGDTVYSWNRSPASTRGVMYEHDLGAYGTLTPYAFKASQYSTFDVEVDVPYGVKPRHMPIYRYLAVTAQGSVLYNSMLIESLTSVSPAWNYRSVLAYNTGKHYAEVYYRADKFNGTPSCRIGVVAESATALDINEVFQPLGGTAGHYAYDTTGFTWENTVSTAAPIATGENTLGIAIDFDTNEIWFSIDGVWISGDPATGTLPSYTMTEPVSEYKFIAIGDLVGTNSGVGQTSTTFRVSSTEFVEAIPAGFSSWEPLTQVGDYGYAAVAKYDNPVGYWRFEAEAAGVINDHVGVNNLTLTGDLLPVIDHDYGFHEAGSLGQRFEVGNDGYAVLDTEIVRAQNEAWTISFLYYPQEIPTNLSHWGVILGSSLRAEDGSEFMVATYDNGNGTSQLEVWTYDDAGSPGGQYREATYSMYHDRWNAVQIIGPGDGTFQIWIDAQFCGSFTFDDNAYFGMKYVGSDANFDGMNGHVAELVYYDKALLTPGGTLNGVQRYYEITQLSYAGTVNYTTSANGPPIGGWNGPASTDEINSLMKSKIKTPVIAVLSDYATLTLTPYDSDVTPKPDHVVSDYATLNLLPYDAHVGPSVNEIYGEYTFDALVGTDTDAFIWTGPAGTGLVTPTGRMWSWESNDTGSTGVGPTSGQGGNPDGYVYTEASGSVFGDVYTIEFDTTIDASLVVADIWTVEFYTNQRGDDNDTTCQLQVNESAAGWINIGPEFGGPTDPNKVATSGVDIWAYRNVDMSSVTDSSVRIRWLVTNALSGTTFHNDYGIDGITISRIKLR